MSKVIIHQEADKESLDSIWFDGLIAETDDYELVATGEIRINLLDDQGNVLGFYDGKARDDFPDIFTDTDLDNENFDWDMNNWFEVIAKSPYDDTGVVADTYNEAIELLKQVQEERSK